MTTSTTEVRTSTDVAALQKLPELNAKSDPLELRYTCNTRISIQN